MIHEYIFKFQIHQASMGKLRQWFVFKGSIALQHSQQVFLKFKLKVPWKTVSQTYYHCSRNSLSECILNTRRDVTKGIQEELSSQEHLVLLQRIQVLFPEHLQGSSQQPVTLAQLQKISHPLLASRGTLMHIVHSKHIQACTHKLKKTLKRYLGISLNTESLSP